MSANGRQPTVAVATKTGVYTLALGEENTARATALHHPLMALVASPERAVLYGAAYKNGLHRSADAGRTWTLLEGTESLDIRAIAVHPRNPDLLLVGTEPVALYESRDRGKSWHELSGLRQHSQGRGWHFPMPPNVAHVRTIALDPDDESVIYAGVEVGTVLRSADRGKSWTECPGPDPDIHRVILQPGTSRVLLVATGHDGVLRSDDAGATWRSINEGLAHRIYAEDALVLDPVRENVMYLAAADGTPPKWADLRKGDAYFVVPAKEVRAKGADVSIFRREQDGPWCLVSAGRPGDGNFDMVWAMDAVAVNGHTCVIIGTTAGECYSWRDGDGQPWRKLATGLAPVTHVAACA